MNLSTTVALAGCFFPRLRARLCLVQGVAICTNHTKPFSIHSRMVTLTLGSSTLHHWPFSNSIGHAAHKPAAMQAPVHRMQPPKISSTTRQPPVGKAFAPLVTGGLPVGFQDNAVPSCAAFFRFCWHERACGARLGFLFPFPLDRKTVLFSLGRMTRGRWRDCAAPLKRFSAHITVFSTLHSLCKTLQRGCHWNPIPIVRRHVRLIRAYHVSINRLQKWS